MVIWRELFDCTNFLMWLQEISGLFHCEVLPVGQDYLTINWSILISILVCGWCLFPLLKLISDYWLQFESQIVMLFKTTEKVKRSQKLYCVDSLSNRPPPLWISPPRIASCDTQCHMLLYSADNPELSPGGRVCTDKGCKLDCNMTNILNHLKRKHPRVCRRSNS